MGCSNSDLEKDTKSVAAKLSRLKNRLQTDKVGISGKLTPPAASLDE